MDYIRGEARYIQHYFTILSYFILIDLIYIIYLQIVRCTLDGDGLKSFSMSFSPLNLALSFSLSPSFLCLLLI